MRRLIVDGGPLSAGRRVLEGDAFQHAVRVWRLRPGARLLLLDGAGSAAAARLVEVAARRAVVEVDPPVRCPEEPGPALTLIVGLARGGRTETAIQKATELGVARIVPVLCERSVARPADAARKRGRFAEVARQAARQSERARVPAVAEPQPLGVALGSVVDPALRLLAHPGGAPLRAFAEAIGAAKRVAIAVGPEGGFTPAERRMAADAGFREVGLGPGILRAETAAIAAMALVAFLAGRLDAPPAAPRDGAAPDR